MGVSVNNAFFGSEPGGRESAPGSLALVQAFVNTREAERGWDLLANSDGLRRWLRGQGLLTRRDPAEEVDEDEDLLVAERARGLREALRGLLAANNGGSVRPADVEILNRAARRAGLSVRFGDDGRAALSPSADGVDGALGRVLAAVHAGMEEGTWGRLKSCANEGCGWAFYDRSKNRSGRWCSMAVCGNRKKTRAYRRRRTAL